VHRLWRDEDAALVEVGEDGEKTWGLRFYFRHSSLERKKISLQQNPLPTSRIGHLMRRGGMSRIGPVRKKKRREKERDREIVIHRDA
jgi:hypothetical protein